MANDKMKDGMTIIMVVLFVGFVAILLNKMGDEVSSSPNSELTLASQSYIFQRNISDDSVGFNTSIYGENAENPLVNGTGESKDEFAIDFNFGKNKASGFSQFLYAIGSVPEYIIVGIFRFSKNNFGWFIGLLNWIYRILIFIAIYAFIRGKI